MPLHVPLQEIKPLTVSFGEKQGSKKDELSSAKLETMGKSDTDR